MCLFAQQQHHQWKKEITIEIVFAQSATAAPMGTENKIAGIIYFAKMAFSDDIIILGIVLLTTNHHSTTNYYYIKKFYTARSRFASF